MFFESRHSSSVLDDLRQQIARLERSKVIADSEVSFRFGIHEIDLAVPCKTFTAAGLHEVVAAEPRSAGSATGFLSTLAHGLAGAHAVIWISREAAVHMPGLLTYGLTPQQTFFVRVKNEREALQAMEEALRSGAFAIVVGELSKANLTVTRRLQLAAETGACMALLLRLVEGQGASSCTSRWLVQAAPSVCEDGIPGIGAPSWNITLDRIKGGTPGQWRVCWKNNAYQFVEQISPAVQLLRHAL